MKRIAFAALLATGLAATAGAAHAQAPGPTGRAPAGGKVVGGGIGATILGGGDDMVILYSQPGAGSGGMALLQVGLSARFLGSHGEGEPQLEYLTAAPADAGREAWLVGGGGDAEVVYASPHRRH